MNKSVLRLILLASACAFAGPRVVPDLRADDASTGGAVAAPPSIDPSAPADGATGGQAATVEKKKKKRKHKKKAAGLDGAGTAPAESPSSPPADGGR